MKLAQTGAAVEFDENDIQASLDQQRETYGRLRSRQNDVANISYAIGEQKAKFDPRLIAQQEKSNALRDEINAIPSIAELIKLESATLARLGKLEARKEELALKALKLAGGVTTTQAGQASSSTRFQQNNGSAFSSQTRENEPTALTPPNLRSPPS